MATTALETLNVKQLSKFGFQLESGEYIGWSKNIPDTDKGKVVAGGEYQCEVYRADSGKGYVNKVVSSSAPAVKKAAPAPAKAAASETMTKAEWSAKDRSQLIGGLSHDAATVVAALIAVDSTLTDPENALNTYRTVLNGMLSIRDEVK